MRNRAIQLICALTFALVAGLAPAIAQAPRTTPAPAAPALEPGSAAAQRLDSARAGLDQIRQTLLRPDVSDATLQSLRNRIDPLAQTIQAIIVELAPRLDDAQKRLAQLGPKPAANAPPEDPSITAERDSQQKLYDAIDGVLKQAHLLAVEADQTSTIIVDRRRALFTRALFAASQSLLAPALWIDVIAELPRDARVMANVGSDWATAATSQLGGWRAAGLLALLAAIGLLYVVVARIARRVLQREATDAAPTRLGKALAALWVAAVTAAVPIAAMIALAAVLRSFGLFNQSFDPLLLAIFEGVARVALAVGLARALLAPSRRNWRLVDIGDATAQSLSALVVVVAAIVSTTKILDALNDLIAASLQMSVAMRSVSALAIALVMAAMLRRHAAPRGDGEALAAKTAAERGWQGPLRPAAWLAVAIIIGAVLLGYIAFAAFLVDQIVWVAFIGSSLYLLALLANDGIAAALEPEAPVGRAMMSSVGLRRESLGQAATLLSGAANVALFVIAAMLILAPWGVESTDMFGSLRSAYFGFTFDNVTISLSSILMALALFAFVLAVTRAIQRWLELSFLPQTQLDSGLRNSIKTSLGYAGFILAVAVALGHLGLTFDQLAIVAGALSVGIGFGLQSIVNNFVSGLILLWERAVKVGDWVVVGDEQGYVKRINVRSTEIETFDRATMIVPNSNLISGVVKNWVSGDRVGRIRVAVPVNLDADPENVRKILIACAKAHDLVIRIPAPQAIFSAMSETGLKFELLCYVGDVETALRVKSDLYFEIFRRFKEAGIGIAPAAVAPVVVNVTGAERPGDIPSHQAPEDAAHQVGQK